MKAVLVTYATSNAPGNKSIDFDTHIGLLQLLKCFASREPTVDLTLPETTRNFTDFLYTFFEPTERKVGVIEMGTIHWSKGLEADDVSPQLHSQNLHCL